MLLIYDGQCGFCVRSAAWIKARLPETARVEPWQSLPLEQLGLTRADAQSCVWWIEGADLESAEVAGGTDDHAAVSPAKFSGSDAIGRSLVAAGGIWAAVGKVVIHPPGRWLAGPAYSLIAANRHRLSRLGNIRRAH